MIYVEKITVTPHTKKLYVGDKYREATAVVCPSNATCKSVRWYSEDTTIATVNVTKGYIKAIAPGKVKIYAEATDDSGVRDYIGISVKQLVNDITLNHSSLTLNVGATKTLIATPLPANASNKSICWTSCNEDVAAVSSNGVVTGIAKGTTDIVASALDGSGVVAYCSVTVNQLVTDISLDCSNATINIGETKTITATVSPSNASNKNISWTSCDESVATVDSNGVVTGRGGGSTTIIASAQDDSGVCGCCEVTCNTPSTDSTPDHSNPSSHIYHATLSKDGNEYTFTCTSSQCDDSFTVPKDQVIGSYVTSSTNPHLGDSQTPLAYGIDVSYHQGEISQSKWNEIANTQIDGYPITFVILRIGREVSNNADGSINRKIDEQFENNYERAKAAGLHVGCYYYTESLSPQNAIEDAEQVIEWIGNKQLEYPVFFDIESNYILDSNNVPNNTVRTEICTAFMNKMREAGFFAGLYANNNWITNHLNSSTLFPEYDFWYARYYDNTPNDWQSSWAGTGKKFGMWQYTQTGEIAPITGYVDCNVANKNYPLIIKSLHLNNF